MSHRQLFPARPTSKEGRPNMDLDAITHRELMRPAPAMIEFEFRPSGIQELTGDSSKRKAVIAGLNPPPTSVNQSQQSTEAQNAKPIKDLKVVQHVFSNGDSFQGQSGNVRTSYRDADAIAVSEGSRSVHEGGNLPASPGHLMYRETRSGKWRTTKRLPRKRNRGADDSRRSELREPMPTQSPNQLVGHDHATSASDDAASAAAVDKEKEDGLVNTAVPSYNCSGRVCYPLPSHNQASQDGHSTANRLASSEDLSESGWNTQQFGPLVPDHSITHHDNNNSNQPSPTDQTASGPIANAMPSRAIPPMSARQMAGNGFEDCLPGVHADDRSPQNHHVKADGNDNDSARLKSADRTMSRSVSPVAHGKVWESQNTRRERRRQEEAAARSDTSTPSLPTPESSIDPNLGTYSGLTLDNAAPAGAENPTDIDLATGSVSTAPASRPTRTKQRDTNCLICLKPVTAADLALARLRCSACPRVFHGPCLSYHTPLINQYWRCSLCFKESWPGYGHLPAERDYKNPSLVEQYRRRLLLATTYEIPGDPEASRFWLDMDLDGDFRSDQIALVKMGVVNEFKLRSVGEMRAQSIVQMERWGVNFGMALQQEESKNEWLMAENEWFMAENQRLRAVLAEKDAEIAELEGEP